jgi:hypothetical protein
MKISLAFGLAQQPIAKLWIKYGTVSKDLAAPGTRKHGIQGAPELLQDKSSFRNTQVWKPKSLEAGMITELIVGRTADLTTGREPVIHANREHYRRQGSGAEKTQEQGWTLYK